VLDFRFSSIFRAFFNKLGFSGSFFFPFPKSGSCLFESMQYLGKPTLERELNSIHDCSTSLAKAWK